MTRWIPTYLHQRVITLLLLLCMGGDYKFLLMVLGMAGATSNHAFIYCKIHTDDRRDMSKAHDFYCQENLARTIEEMSQNALSNYQWLQA